jgi:acyl-coenzyme A thioesterase PaaI-like protein
MPLSQVRCNSTYNPGAQGAQPYAGENATTAASASPTDLNPSQPAISNAAKPPSQQDKPHLQTQRISLLPTITPEEHVKSVIAAHPQYHHFTTSSTVRHQRFIFPIPPGEDFNNHLTSSALRTPTTLPCAPHVYLENCFPWEEASSPSAEGSAAVKASVSTHASNAASAPGPAAASDSPAPGAPQLHAFYHLSRGLAGHAGIAHGGFLGVLLDDCMDRVAVASLPHRLAVTANLSLDFVRVCELEAVVCVRAWVERREGRKCWVRGSVEDPLGGDVFVKARGLFIEPKGAENLPKLV